MSKQTIEIEAETLEEARKRVKSQIPKGLHLLSEKVISTGKPKVVKSIADTIELAFTKAQSEIPTDAIVVEKKQLRLPAQRTMAVEAFDEKSARMQIERQIGKTEIIRILQLAVAGKRGVLGIGKKPNLYHTEVFQQAVVRVTYKTKAKISVTFGERKAQVKKKSTTAKAKAKISATMGEKKPEVIKLAVLAYQERDGSLKIKGEDAKGRSFELGDVSQPALLFVPRETLPYLKRNEKIWGRVKNPEATFDEKSSLKQAPAAGEGLLSSLLLGPLMASIEASDLLPGEFRINIVDTYADAKIKVEGIGLFG